MSRTIKFCHNLIKNEVDDKTKRNIILYIYIYIYIYIQRFTNDWATSFNFKCQSALHNILG